MDKIKKVTEESKDVDRLAMNNEKPLEKVITVLIPYNRLVHKSNSLLYAIRSIRLNFLSACNIIVIGDKEDWFDAEVVEFIEHDHLSDVDLDLIDKIKTAIITEQVSDEFILSFPNLYYVTPVCFSDIQVVKADNGHFFTKTPFALSKDRLVELFEKQTDISPLIEQYYSNLHPGLIPIRLDWRSDNWTFSVISSNPDKKMIKEFIARKKWMCSQGDGYSPLLENILTEMFGHERKDHKLA